MADSDNTFYPPVSFSFKLAFTKIKDKMDAAFQEASGLNVEMGIEEVTSGGENRFKYRLPGVNKFNNLVLKRGLIPKGSALSKWVNETIGSGLAITIKPQDITLSLLDAKGSTLISWDFIQAYPAKMNVSEFKSMENAYAVETIEFVYQYFKKN